MIVGDDEGFAGLFADSADALGPGLQFLERIEIVVTLVLGDFGIVVKPSVVAAAVQADVADRRRGEIAGLERTANHGLVDAAEGGVVFAKKSEHLDVVPGGV